MVEIDEIVEFIREKIYKYHYKGAVIGISGGIDSAVTAKLTVLALGQEKVLGLLMPDRDSSKNTLKESKLVANSLGIGYKVMKLTWVLRFIGVYRLFPPAWLFPRKFQEKWTRKTMSAVSEDPFIDDLHNAGPEKMRKGFAYYRIKHRLRMILEYFYAERLRYAVVGCTNKTELVSGFFVKYGDDSSDIAPIAHLYKTQVYELAHALDIPEVIIHKSPSPDLMPGVTDEFALDMKYTDLDRILLKLEQNESLGNEDPKLVERVKKITNAAGYRSIKSVHL
ncbi:MAG: NAD(+) synthase [Candidatus Lokiarchaeota archaeon]|nr:NAD(+) synthase [Candidatus Lokiarchaeota archaeon]